VFIARESARREAGTWERCGPSARSLASLKEELMNVFKKNMRVTAMALPIAGLGGLVLAQDSTGTDGAPSLQLEKTMAHDTMMNREDARKHDEIVRHDLAVKEAAAKAQASAVDTTTPAAAAATTEDGAASAAAAARAQATKDATEVRQEQMTRQAEAAKDQIDARQDRMNDRMEAHKDAIDARQDRINESLEAQKEAQQSTLDARREALENQAEAKEAAVDAKDSAQPVTDTWITTKVKAMLATTEGVSSTDITVNTVDGTVYLTGVVADAASIARATAAAQGIEGVKKVDASGLKSMR
jgi:hyperosmotically inducible protein